MISIAFDQISADFFQIKEKTQTMCRNMAVIYNVNVIISSKYSLLYRKRKKYVQISLGIVQLVCTVGYCMMVEIRGYHDVGQSSLQKYI